MLERGGEATRVGGVFFDLGRGVGMGWARERRGGYESRWGVL